MFTKLMKYEMKSLTRTLMPLYGVILIVSIVNRIIMGIDFSGDIEGLPQMTALMLYIGLFVAVAVVTFLIVIQRFYKGLLGQEGYLMFTLPVPTWQLTCSKLVCATLMAMLSGVVGLLSIFILSGIGIGDLVHSLQRTFLRLDMDMFLRIVELILNFVIGTVASLLQIYLAMALGHLANRHRVAMSFVWYMVISTALSFVSVVLVMAVGEYSSFIEWFLNTMIETQTHMVLWFGILSSLVEAVVFYIGTNWILKNKLNLE